MNPLDYSFITGVITGVVIALGVAVGLIWAVLASDNKDIKKYRS